MRCSCRQCGVYMVQEEYGLQSGCKCPACGAMCHDCMGSAQQPLKPEDIKSLFALGAFTEAVPTDVKAAEDKLEYEADSMENWRKNL